jgi:hypothetical protein
VVWGTHLPFGKKGVNLYVILYAVHDYFKHAGGRDVFLLDWRQVLSYDVSFLNIRIVVNSVINLVNTNLPRTALQIKLTQVAKNQFGFATAILWH